MNTRASTAWSILGIALAVAGVVGLGVLSSSGPQPVEWQPSGIVGTDWACDHGQLLYRYNNTIDGTHSITAAQDIERRCAR